MVQRKSATRLRPQPGPKKASTKTECPPAPVPGQQPESKKKGVVDLKMMLKKARSIKLLEGDLLQDSKKKPSKPVPGRSPNYMKPTSSSHAREDRPEVTADKKKSTKIPASTLGSSRPPSSSSDHGSVMKSSKALVKRLSLKLMSPWVKKIPVVDLNANINMDVSRATCSSTLKGSKFSKTLVLNPGASEAAGTSVAKVCPYTYCSLNGHRHEPLPSLARVISVRRRALKSQKSMRLKGLSSFKVRGLRRSNKEVDSREMIITRVPSLRAPLIEEVDDDDFFVEIYAKPQTQIVEIAESLEGFSLVEGGGEHDGADWISESSLEISFEDDMDRYSDLSVEEKDVVSDFLEYIEQDEQVEGDDNNDLICYVPHDYAEWGFGCGSVDAFGEESEGIAESIANISTFESTDLYWEGEEKLFLERNTDLCRYIDDGYGPVLYPSSLVSECGSDQPPFQLENASVSSEIAGEDEQRVSNFASDIEEDRWKIDLPSSVEDETSEMSIVLVNQLTDVADLNPEPVGSSVPAQEHDLDGQLTHTSIINVGEEGSKIDVPSTFEDDSTDNLVSQVLDVINPNSESLKPAQAEEIDQDDVNHKQDDAVSHTAEGKEGEFEAKETSLSIDERLNNTIHGDGNEKVDNRMEEFVEDDDGNSMMKIQFSDSPQGFYEIDLELTEDGDGIIEHSEQSLNEAGSNPTARYSYVRRRTTEDVHEMKGFNPRAPHFLPEVSDPEAEKVDLRHQEMEDRKNAEDWMVDYALQRTVSRLARARSRKVRLFVEAFETVLQPPAHETSQQRAKIDLDQARRLQYCR